MFHFSDKKTSKGKDSRNDTSDEDEGSQQGKQLILLLSCVRYTLEGFLMTIRDNNVYKYFMNSK